MPLTSQGISSAHAGFASGMLEIANFRSRRIRDEPAEHETLEEVSYFALVTGAIVKGASFYERAAKIAS